MVHCAGLGGCQRSEGVRLNHCGVEERPLIAHVPHPRVSENLSQEYLRVESRGVFGEPRMVGGDLLIGTVSFLSPGVSLLELGPRPLTSHTMQYFDPSRAARVQPRFGRTPTQLMDSAGVTFVLRCQAE